MICWANRYIGLPWVAGEHDCWAFCRRVWLEVFGLDVPAVDVDAMRLMDCARAFSGHRERAQWYQVPAPADGDAVLMGKSKRPSHVGVWCAAAGGVVHCVRGAGVVLSDRMALKTAGLLVLGNYRRSAP